MDIIGDNHIKWIQLISERKKNPTYFLICESYILYPVSYEDQTQVIRLAGQVRVLP